jgi:LPXTG-motif cell wall-anchored protein
MKVIGIVLILLGFAGLLFGGVPYRTTENVAEIGDFKMKVSEKKQFTVPPVISGLAILGGAAMLFASRRKEA